jgi:hypothetical protein
VRLHAFTVDCRWPDLPRRDVADRHGYASVADLQHQMRARAHDRKATVRIIPTGIELDSAREWVRLELLP